MSLWRTFKVSWEGLTLNKVRSFLTTLGVIIGVGAVIAMREKVRSRDALMDIGAAEMCERFRLPVIVFNLFEPGIFNDIIASLKSPHDPWLTLADFRSYVDAHEEAAAAYRTSTDPAPVPGLSLVA